PVDRRTDIFAFGAVLYEMLTGRRAFTGETVTEILARVIERDPDWNRLPKNTPASIRRLLERSLRKDRSRRLQPATDARIEIEDARTEQPPLKSAVPRIAAARTWRTFWTWSAAVIVVILAVIGTWYLKPAPQ